jgi:hypothetical protein
MTIFTRKIMLSTTASQRKWRVELTLPESVTPSVDAEYKSLISICFSKIAGAAIGSPLFLGSKEASMACALCHYGVTDSGRITDNKLVPVRERFIAPAQMKSLFLEYAN